MCWCRPLIRTPCCGTLACHEAACRAGKLTFPEECPFCARMPIAPPGPSELAAIRHRARRGYADTPTCLRDVPVLLAEVDRLNAEIEEVRRCISTSKT